eukprot:11418-Eustigmatos_ZCMA.PRE.1
MVCIYTLITEHAVYGTGDGDAAGALQSKVVAVLRRLMLEEEGGWEARHGGFLGLKYLVAVPTE